MPQWLVARVQIIQIFLLLVELKETKPNRERTSLLPERWCNQRGMLIDRPDNRTAQRRSLGSIRASRTMSPFMRINNAHQWSGWRPRCDRRTWLAVENIRVMFSSEISQRQSPASNHGVGGWKGLYYITDEGFICCWGTTVKNHAMFFFCKKEISLTFFQQEYTKYTLLGTTIKVSELLN